MTSRATPPAGGETFDAGGITFVQAAVPKKYNGGLVVWVPAFNPKGEALFALPAAGGNFLNKREIRALLKPQ
jgi:hypothetical protein